MASNNNAKPFSESDVFMYLATVFKYGRLMVLMVCLAMAGGIFYLAITRSVYYSKSIIHYRNFARPVDSDAIWHDANDRTITAVIQSPEVIDRTARRLGLDSDPAVLYTKYLRRIVVARTVGDRDITVEVYAFSKKITRDWAKTMLQEYLARRDENRIAFAENEINSLTEDMGQYKERMEHELDQKFDFKQKNELDQLTITLDDLKQVPEQLSVLEHQIAVMDHARDLLQNETNQETVAKLALLDSVESDPSSTLLHQSVNNELNLNVGEVVPSVDSNETPAGGPEIVVLPSMMPQANSDKDWENLDKERHRLLLELQITGQKFLPGHPQMVALQKQLDAVNKSLDLDYNVAYDRFNLDYANLLEKQKLLEAKLPAYEDAARRHEKLTKAYTQFDSGQLAWGNLFNSTSKKLETLDFGFDKDRDEFQYAGFLDYMDDPVSPNAIRTIFYSFLLGIALAVAVPFLIEYLSDRVSDIEHAEETLHIRGLGIIPKVTDAPIDRLLLQEGDDHSDHHVKESFRLIRTNLVINSENGSLPQVILVTSAMPQEGKTVVAANLALSFAAKGEKTLLIDGDLRRGRIHKFFDRKSNPGLSNVLAGQLTADQACHANGHENLSVMTCGKHLNSGAELLDNKAFTDLMLELRGKYQRIIMDTPPVLGLSETLIMQRVCDGVLMVIWSDFTPMNSIKSALQLLQVNGAKFAGFVLNRLDFSTLNNRYKYFYYAPHYYMNYRVLPPAPEPAAPKAE
jgi:capsular exopolysaccharide synthesis family protein